jgi:hypothetical protein
VLRAVELVKSASANFPGLRLQNWDVAPEGPVLLELMDQRPRDILHQVDTENQAHRAAGRSTH